MWLVFARGSPSACARNRPRLRHSTTNPRMAMLRGGDKEAAIPRRHVRRPPDQPYAGSGRLLPAQYNQTSPIMADSADPSRMPSFACSTSAGFVNASWAMNSDIVKPMPASQAAPIRCFHCTPEGSRADAQAHRDPAEQADAEELAGHQPGEDAERHACSKAPASTAIAAQVDARIGQRENRDDDERHPRREAVLDPLQRALHGGGGALHALPRSRPSARCSADRRASASRCGRPGTLPAARRCAARTARA